MRLALGVGTDLYADEAYYWLWSKHLDWSYYDHPPLVAWCIAVFGVRGTAWWCGLGTLAGVFTLARAVHRENASAWRATALWSAVPAGVIAGVFTTPDTPLFLFWVLSLWALWTERWVLAGVLCGLALLSKYPAVLVGAAFALSALRWRRLPQGAWLTLLIAAAVFSPVVFWNAQREWVAFAFQLKHGLGGTGGWPSLAEFLGGQLLMAGPLVFLFTLVWIARGPSQQFFLRAAALLPLLVFGFAAFRTRGEANWAATAYLSACVGLAATPRHRWIRGASVAQLSLMVLGAAHLLWPWIPVERDVPLQRTQGWAPLQTIATRQATALFAPSYQMASEAAYYMGLPVDTVDARQSQFELWPPLPLPKGSAALWLSEGQEPPESLTARFQRVEGPEVLEAEHRGRQLHRFHLWRLEGALQPNQQEAR